MKVWDSTSGVVDWGRFPFFGKGTKGSAASTRRTRLELIVKPLIQEEQCGFSCPWNCGPVLYPLVPARGRLGVCPFGLHVICGFREGL